MTVTEFLLARIAEDGAEIGAEIFGHDDSAGPNGIGWADVGAISEVLMIAHKRALAECKAKRRIVELHPSARPEVKVKAAYNPGDTVCGGCTVQVGNGLRFPRVEMHPPFPCPTLRALALPYANHPDYDEAWRV